MTVQPLTTATTSLEKLTWNWQGHQVQYTVQGEGLPLLLIHGFGASIGHWRKNIPVLAEGGYRVFALDLLGFGGSDKPPLQYTLDLWEELIKDFWTAHIQTPTVFVGNSIGGLLSLMLVAHHPEIAAGAVLLNSAGGLNHRPDELDPPLRIVMSTFTWLVGSKLAGPLLFNRVRQKQQIRRTLYQVYRNREAVTDELVDLLYEPSTEPGALAVFASVLSAPPGPRPTDLLPQVKCPLLVLWGESDPWTPISGAQIYQKLGEQSEPGEFPRVQVIPIPDTGHCPHDERPEIVNPLILKWLDQLQAAGSS